MRMKVPEPDLKEPREVGLNAVRAAGGRRGSFMVRLKWTILGGLFVLELAFDYVLEPWLNRMVPAHVLNHLFPLAEVAAIGSVIWVVFVHLERLEQNLETRRRELANLYDTAMRWDGQLEALHDASVAVATSNSYASSLQAVVSLAAGLARSRFGALAVFDEAGQVTDFITHGVGEDVRARIGLFPTHRGLLRRLSGSAPVCIADVRRDPEFTGFPSGHPGFHTFLGVPIRWKGELLGHLYLGGKNSDTGNEAPFDEEDSRLLEMFAASAAVIIVREQTNRTAAEAVRSTERQRIAMELHDHALQSLYAVGLQLGRAQRRGLRQITDTMSTETALAAVQRSMRSIRNLLDTLDRATDVVRTPASLRDTVQRTADLYNIRLLWVDDQLVARVANDCLPDLEACLSEAVTNAARHGRARTVNIQFERTGQGILVTIRDNGRGTEDQEVRQGHGLANMRHRVEHLGGTINFVTGPDAGLTIRIVLPDPSGGEPS